MVRWVGRVALATMLFAMLVAGAASAQTRPNALDREVDAISTQALLTHPAAVMVDPDRRAAAQRLVAWTLPGWLLIPLLQAAVLAYFWSSGGAAGLRRWLRARTQSEWMVRFCFGAALGLIARATATLPAFYLYRVDWIMGLTQELTRTWLLFWIAHSILAAIVAGIIAAFVLWLVDRSHQWYVFTIGAVLAVSVGWSYASPYFQLPSGRTVAPVDGTLGADLHTLLRRAGFGTLPVLIERSHGAPIGRAVVLGVGSSRRIVLTDTLVAGATPPEVAYAVAIQLGHLIPGDPLSIALIEGGIVIVFSALAVVIADRIRFRRDDDALSRLALVGALFALMYLIAVPVRNVALRAYDYQADRYAMTLTGDRAAAVRALVRAADQRLAAICPDTLAMLYLGDHPPIAMRVFAINGVPTGCR